MNIIQKIVVGGAVFNKDGKIFWRYLKLTEQEAMMLRGFTNYKINNGRWYDEYRKKYINIQIGRPYSRQAIYNQLEALHQKLFEFLKTKDMIPKGFDISKIKREKIS